MSNFTRFQFGVDDVEETDGNQTEETQPEYYPELHRSGTNAITFYSDGRMQMDKKEVNADTASPADPQFGQDILASAHDSNGRIASRLTDDTLVNVGGMEVSIKTAMKMGLVTQDANGNFSERYQRTQPTSNDGSESVAEPSEPEAKPNPAAGISEKLQSLIGHHSAENLIAKAIGGNLSQADREIYAAELNSTPDELAETLDEIHEAQMNFAKHHLSSMFPNVDPDLIIEYANEKAQSSKEMKMRLNSEIIYPQFYEGDMSGWDRIANEFIKSYPEENLPVGTTMREVEGRTLIKLPGQTKEVDLVVAAKVGLLK